MAEMTLAEIESSLTTVNAAIEQLIQNKRITRLEVGSGSSKRVYEKQEVNMENLLDYRNQLMLLKASLTPQTFIPTFNNFCSFPLVVRKDIY